jgi:hypothetical protein
MSVKDSLLNNNMNSKDFLKQSDSSNLDFGESGSNLDFTQSNSSNFDFGQSNSSNFDFSESGSDLDFTQKNLSDNSSANTNTNTNTNSNSNSNTNTIINNKIEFYQILKTKGPGYNTIIKGLHYLDKKKSKLIISTIQKKLGTGGGAWIDSEIDSNNKVVLFQGDITDDLKWKLIKPVLINELQMDESNIIIYKFNSR